jgi:hypothetical protein
MVSLSHLLAGLFPFCSINSLLTNFAPVPHGFDPLKSCPTIASQADFDHRKKYSCLNHTYKTAKFLVDGCNILPLEMSTQILASLNVNVAYVGDSLMKQLFLSNECMQELYGIKKVKPLMFVHDLFLRNDLPCDNQCLTNHTFLVQETFFHPCWACKYGVRKNFSNYLNDTEYWLNKLPVSEVSALVLGTGAWYNFFHGLINSTATYIETLQQLGPILLDLQTQRGIRVFWLGLPPRIVEGYSLVEMEWKHFEEKDSLAKQVLGAFNVTFIDTSTLIRQRIVADPSISADGLHWW